MVNLESSLKAQRRKIQGQEKEIGEQTLRFDNIEEKVAALQDQVKRLAEEAKQVAESTLKTLWDEIASCHNNLIGVLSAGLSTSISEKSSKAHTKRDSHDISK